MVKMHAKSCEEGERRGEGRSGTIAREEQRRTEEGREERGGGQRRSRTVHEELESLLLQLEVNTSGRMMDSIRRAQHRGEQTSDDVNGGSGPDMRSVDHRPRSTTVLPLICLCTLVCVRVAHRLHSNVSILRSPCPWARDRWAVKGG